MGYKCIHYFWRRWNPGAICKLLHTVHTLTHTQMCVRLKEVVTVHVSRWYIYFQEKKNTHKEVSENRNTREKLDFRPHRAFSALVYDLNIIVMLYKCIKMHTHTHTLSNHLELKVIDALHISTSV